MLVHSRIGMPELKVKGFGFVELLLLLLLLLHLVWSFGEFLFCSKVWGLFFAWVLSCLFLLFWKARDCLNLKKIIIIIETVVAFVYSEDPRGFSPEGEATCPTGS